MTTAAVTGTLKSPYLPSLPLSPVGGRELASCGAYSVLLASSDEERVAIYRLRFQVFNLELNEGLEESYATGLDKDEFDAVCDHIYVQHRTTGEVVGTYRVQSGPSAV